MLRWPVPDASLVSPEVEYRNQFARALASIDPDVIAQRYAYISLANADRLIRLLERYVLDRPLVGIGAELGAGCGVIAASVALRPDVKQIYAIEVCEEMVRLVIPKVAGAVLGKRSDTVIPVFGTFDNIDLPDGSLDFIVELGSLHHSHDLQATLRESARVLRAGGYLIALDRAQPDSTTDDEIQSMLEQVYPSEFLIANNYPPGIRLTRRENGEREYRYREWREAFRSVGLPIIKTREFVTSRSPVSGRERFRHAIARSGLEPLLRLPIIAPRAVTVFLARRDPD
jgi:SAM-dependent methyltransferase